ncbi:MAG: DegT/DnrJ/EryC1/StrS family aminotransferase [Ilumatobacteraceae bacterium]
MTTVRYFSLARHALVEALHAINIQPGEAVALPALICRDVLASLNTVGARPVFYHVDEQLRPMTIPDDKGIRAVIVVNYFGFAQDLVPFIQYCSSTKAILIEDNAHGFLSADETGQRLGTRSAIGITSIRKTIRIPDGAMLSVNDPRLFEQIHDQLPETTYSIYTFQIRRLSAIVERRFHIPILRVLRTISRTIRMLKTGSPLPVTSAASETELLQLTGPHKSSLHILERLDPDAEMQRRRNLYIQVHQSLFGLPLTPLYPELPQGTVPYGYPFISDEPTMQSAQRRVTRFGVEIIRWPDLPDAIMHSAPFHYTNLWLVNFL